MPETEVVSDEMGLPGNTLFLDGVSKFVGVAFGRGGVETRVGSSVDDFRGRVVLGIYVR